MPPNEWAAVDALIDRHLAEHHLQLLRHFAQYCIEKGLTKPSPYPSHMEKKQTWQERGRRMYGAAPFDRVVQELSDAQRLARQIRKQATPGPRSERSQIDAFAGTDDPPPPQEWEDLSRDSW